MPHAALTMVACVLVAVVLSGDAAPLPACPTQQTGAAAGDVLRITSSCSLPSPLSAAAGDVRVAGVIKPQLPLLLISSGKPAATAAGPSGAGALQLQRLVVAGAKLTPPASSDTPPLWPLGLTEAVGSSLNISDTRLIVDASDLQQYAEHLQSLPRALVQFHTDGKTFVHIAAWEGRKTRANSVTLISGGCLAAAAAADATAFAETADALAGAAQDGCNVQSVDNSTLVPTLLRYASLPTPQPLLVLIPANVSLGQGLRPGAIPVRRPVVLVGLYSVVASMDFGMVVNQINATSGKHAKVFFQSLFLENVAPGDAISSLLSRPMSSAVSANVYAVYCDRMQNCLNLHNCTVVLASPEEMSYTTYMYSMFNSPLPNMRANVRFYHDELRCVIIDMGPGPGGVGMFLKNLTCRAWDVYSYVFTTQPAVAPRLPFPDGAPQITAATTAGPLVQSVRDCQDLQASMQFQTVETRLHVWMLLDSIDLQPESLPNCWVNRTIRYPTQIYGRPHHSASQDDHALSFGFLRDAVQLPEAAETRFLSIFNTTLLELPQGPDPRQASTPGRWPPDMFTLLLWSIGRSKTATDAVYLQDVSILLPVPEFNFLAQQAAATSSFAVQLMGGDDLTFKGSTAVAPDQVRMQSIDGPGLLGANVELRPVPAGQPLPPDYFWPAAAAADGLPLGQPSGLTAGQLAGIIVGSVGAVALLLAAVFAGRHRQQRRQRRFDMLPPQKPASDSTAMGSTASSCRACPSKDASHKSGANAADVAMDVCPARDVLPPLPAPGRTSTESRQSAQCAAAPAAASTSNSMGSAVAASLPSAALSSSAAQSSSSDSLSVGLDRWKAAISTTTMHLLERRMQLVGGGSGANGGSSASASARAASGTSSRPSGAQGAGGAARSNGSGPLQPAGSGGGGGSQRDGLQIHELLGQGSFGSVWLATWHGKTVAVKIMSLPATGPFPHDRQPAALMAANQANSPPHMAIMEAVLSSTVSHPNVVQVHHFFVSPLGVGNSGDCSDGGPSRTSSAPKITGWELKLVMAYCNGGTLREALDRRTLHGTGPDAKYLPRDTILSLTHDVAAALLHLHSQGVVHGDLKAANVMLTQCADGEGGMYAAALGHKVKAQVADFGLALPLDPADTHATMAARGTPTHMSPELFMNGHVSKASDVWALGILLHELVTGQRPYSGVPIPLLPHEVAVKGLRPAWPAELPEAYRDLQALAAACWAQEPQDRPTITDIFSILARMVAGKPVLHMLPELHHDAVQPPAQQHAEGSSSSHHHQQQQQQGAMQPSAAAAAAAAAADAAGGRKKHMSWSEVSFVSPPA